MMVYAQYRIKRQFLSVRDALPARWPKFMEYPHLNFLGAVGCRNVQEIFGDLSYFDDSFDTLDEARI